MANCKNIKIGQQLARLPGAAALVTKCKVTAGGGGQICSDDPFKPSAPCPRGQKCVNGHCSGGGGGGGGNFKLMQDSGCVSAVSCKRLTQAYKGWPISRNNRKACGESDNGFHIVSLLPPAQPYGHQCIFPCMCGCILTFAIFFLQSGKKCFGGQNKKSADTDGWVHAENICYEAGGRLCTMSELKAGVPMHTGCGHDGQRVWSSTGCTTQGIKGYISMVGTGKPQCARDSTNHAVRCCADVTVSKGMHVCDKFAAGEIKSKQCTSAKTCQQLSRGDKSAWPAKRGDSRVCGTFMLLITTA